MSSKGKRKRFTLDLKYKIIKLIDNKSDYDNIVKKYASDGIDIKNVYQIKSQRENIINAYEKSAIKC
jgi:hypothetical protein